MQFHDPNGAPHHLLQQQQQQQQLFSLLSAALAKDDSATAAAAATTSSSSSAASLSSPLLPPPPPPPSSASTAVSAAAKPGAAGNDESSRLVAIESLHHAIVHPHNSILVSHSAAFLSQGLSQLVSDKSFAVRQSAAVTYGALCAVVCSIPITSHGRQNHVMLGAMVDRFIGWALPFLSTISAGDGTAELSLDSLREFLDVGDVIGIERYALPILKACQQLLEDERTSLVDLLLGWALVPDLGDSDRLVIMDCFLQFQKHWVGSLQFSLGLLSKFLGDMDVLLQDSSTGTPQQFRRLLALISCFMSVLKCTASGLLEANLLEQISEPLGHMLPRLLGCLSMVGQRFGWSKWSGDLWKCLTLLAEILRERFSPIFPLALDILFRSLGVDDSDFMVGSGRVSASQVRGVLKTNLQLLSLQKLGLLPSSVEKLLQFDAPISKFRLHPDHVVAASCAATYVFLVQHGSDEVVQQANASLLEELRTLKSMLEHCVIRGENANAVEYELYSKLELYALVKFDLKVLLASALPSTNGGEIGPTCIGAWQFERSQMVTCFLLEVLNPFLIPISVIAELQVTVMVTLARLSFIELLGCHGRGDSSKRESPVGVAGGNLVCLVNPEKDYSSIVTAYLEKYGGLIIRALNLSSPLAVKVAALDWMQKFCENFLGTEFWSSKVSLFDSFICSKILGSIIISLLDASSDIESKVRLRVASVLELLLQTRLVHPLNLPLIAQAALDKLGDPNSEIKDSFKGLLSHVLPTMVYSCGLCDFDHGGITHEAGFQSYSKYYLQWKQLFSLKQMPQQLHAQQLISLLSYISQRWKPPFPSWIERLVQSCRKNIPSQLDEIGNSGATAAWLDITVNENALEDICSVNVLAGLWWAVNEAARYCIGTRLRTNLGGPSQTFAALERMLLDVAHLLTLDVEQIDGSLNVTNPSGAHLLPMRLLLDFVEALKKNVYNAYEGTVVFPSVSRQSSLFFRANKKVCEEWFSRICEPMMNAGMALNSQCATIQYCSLRLHEIKSAYTLTLKEKAGSLPSENTRNSKARLSGDMLRVLRQMALALCRCQEPEALVGLQSWASSAFSSVFIDESRYMNDGVDMGPLAWFPGLVFQARGQYEKATAYFINLLQTDSINSMDSDGMQFVIDRIIESYSALSDWKGLESWLLELQILRMKHAGKSFIGALTTAGNEMNSIHALAHFDEGDFKGSWGCLNLTPKSSSNLSLVPRIAVQRSEQMLLQAMLLHEEGKVDKVHADLQKAKEMLEEVLTVLPLDGLTDASSYATQLHCIWMMEHANCSKDNPNECRPPCSILSTYVQPMQHPIIITPQDCRPWLKILRVYKTISPVSPVTLNLCISMLSLARKHDNINLAKRLQVYLSDHVPRCSEGSLCDSLSLKLEYEGILLMYAENKYEDALNNLWLFLRPCMSVPAPLISDANQNILKAKACLKLSNWLQCDYSNNCLEIFSNKLLSDFMAGDSSFLCKGDILVRDEGLSSGRNAAVIIEGIVGTVTKLSTQLCPAMGKSWISYASWCFNQAKYALDESREKVLPSCLFSPSLISEITGDSFELNAEEIAKVKWGIQQLFPKSGNVMDFNDAESNGNPLSAKNDMWLMNDLVQEVVKILQEKAGAPGAESSADECLSTSVASSLRALFLHSNVELTEDNLVTVVDHLVDVWWSLRRRRVSLFGHAAHGFMQYLLYSSSRICHNQCSGYESLKHKTSSLTLRATLFVLQILVNFGMELQEIVESSLSAIPLLPWQDVTPQLFARLSSHPEQVVRRQLQSLLVMLGRRSPWSIVYATLVDVSANESEASSELQHVLACLRELHPRLIQDVQLMISELVNVTVLWEELWLSTLQDLHADVMRRIHVLKEEAARIAESVTLSQDEKNRINGAKYSAMMAPIIVALERRLASTSRKPETPHENWFHEQYIEQIKAAIATFKSPPKSSSSLGDVWRPFDAIAASLASYQRKSSVSLGEVAPRLALLSHSDIPMPGLEKRFSLPEADGALAAVPSIPTVASFSQEVVILPTKTKPKRISILGSDGQKYTFLLKGREDLRLDARIMQLLQAINGLLHLSHLKRAHSVDIRHYSVTPISGRAGLIQWVDNMTSIYSIYKCWQTRFQAAQLLSSGTTISKTATLPVPRPSDLFYGKIIPALKEKGIKKVISRRDWPHEVKRKVFLDLMMEVPKDLLQQELWCSSEGFKAFCQKIKKYSGSVAAMSIVGHVLGLGDRHLDNILVDFCTGDILHIDYNICFDKGQRLKIPEIVPFRLTQMIETALGLTGIEGSFRANCEAVLGILRKNKDILLMLLEAFVWDPLVEWTRGDFHDDAVVGGEERKGMELAVSLSLFASRVQELRVPLQEHHDLLLTSLPAINSAIERFSDVLNKYEILSALFSISDQERSNLLLHETSAKTMVTETSNSTEKIRASFEIQAREFSQAKAVVSEKAQEAMNWIEQHGRILDAIQANFLPKINDWISLSNSGDAWSLLSAVLDARVPLSVVPEPTQAQCVDIDREVSQLISELDHAVSSSLTALHLYSQALQRILPLNYLTTSVVHGWARILQLCSNALSSDIISLARIQAAELISKILNDSPDSVKHSHAELCLKLDSYVYEIKKAEEECAELEIYFGSDTEKRAEGELLSTIMKCMLWFDLERKDTCLPPKSGPTYGPAKDAKHHNEMMMKKDNSYLITNLAAASLYDEVKYKVLSIDNGNKEDPSDYFTGNASSLCFQLEEQIQKCTFIEELIEKLQSAQGGAFGAGNQEAFADEWLPSLRDILVSCKNLVDRMSDNALPDLISAAIISNTEVMDLFESIAQVHISVNVALEQQLDVERERKNLNELEKNYFVDVGRITERQLALEEAAVRGRDHLSWEEAEELASQEEACRTQLDKLHQTWNQREKRTTSIVKREADIRSALKLCEQHFSSLVNSEDNADVEVAGGKNLFTTMIRPFDELVSLDKALTSFSAFSVLADTPSCTGDTGICGPSKSAMAWKLGGLVTDHSFFIWKLSVLYSFMDSCIQSVNSSINMSFGFDQLLNVVKRTLVIQLEKQVGEYLKDRILPNLVSWLERKSEYYRQLKGFAPENSIENLQKDCVPFRNVQNALKEYCNACETAHAARSAALLMKKKVNELSNSLRDTGMEIVQMEWMHDSVLTPSPNSRIMLQNFISTNDSLHMVILNLNRQKLLDMMQSSIQRIVQCVEGLQAIERSSGAAEGQLERAMVWACGGSSNMTGNSSNRISNIPPEFHDHILRRRQLMWNAKEKASEIMRICMSILEFEASRDGIFQASGEIHSLRSSSDCRTWQQAFFNALARLDISFHSFTRIEQEWNFAQSSMEAASSNLSTARNELSIASVKAKSASDDLQITVLAMRDRAYEASIALSTFGKVSRGHTALTSECGTMLEEVLAITEDLHDVHSLAKEASSVHCSLMENLTKANAFLLPLEAILSKDVTAMTDAIARERETKAEISPIHGQAIYQSYRHRIGEASQLFKPLLPSLIMSVKGVYSMISKLAQAASIHSGNLHEALGDARDSQKKLVARHELSRPDNADLSSAVEDDDNELSSFGLINTQELQGFAGLTLDDNGFLSAPESICTSSFGSEVSSSDASASNKDNFIHVPRELHSFEDGNDGEVSSVTSIVDGSGDLPETEPSSTYEQQAMHYQTSGISAKQISGLTSDRADEAIPEKVNSEGATVALPPDVHGSCERSRGKNPYAMSVLRRIEMKLDGHDIASSRKINIPEQVDYLIKQATSVDNLCNMYEGWTPWI
ncbi:hypothetical protein MLD38_027001 [Melastoma candidum]|uniref:Uncharacterized protein n=1 Tax=Melastoma candidum TaxID=119954 RepID=A0ACB9P1P8_9MYRT|nr:hypothetical protein MLD38_027001 [Melastoma candidum]